MPARTEFIACVFIAMMSFTVLIKAVMREGDADMCQKDTDSE